MTRRKPFSSHPDLAVYLPLGSLRWISLLVLWWLLFWGASWEARLNMDGMTYGALAKHILSTGDWKTLHYSSQAYSNYYQHPPLMIWLTALVFKLFGVSEWSAKLLPSLFCLGTTMGAVIFGSVIRSPFCGFLSGLILLTSTRFIKYGANLLLDGPLGFFMICGALLIWRLGNLDAKKASTKRLLTLSTLLGIDFALSFMTKGMPSLLLPVLFLLGCFLSFSSFTTLFRRQFVSILISFAVAGTLIALWCFFADGLHFLNRYWIESVKDRLGDHDLMSLLRPTQSLFKGYWPWVPFYFSGILCFFYTLFIKELPQKIRLLKNEGIPLLFSIGILGGFSLSGHFLEHYLVPFFSFSAIVVAFFLEKPLKHFESKIVAGLFILSLCYSLILATLPIHVQGFDFADPQQIILKRASAECNASQISRIYISNRNTGLWWGLALGLWHTPWDTQVIDTNQIPPQLPNPQEKILLSIQKTEPIPALWKPTGIIEKNELILQPVGENLCP